MRVQISGLHWNQDEDMGGFGGPHCMVVGGYGQAFRAVAQLLDVRLDTPVTQVGAGGWGVGASQWPKERGCGLKEGGWASHWPPAGLRKGDRASKKGDAVVDRAGMGLPLAYRKGMGPQIRAAPSRVGLRTELL